MTRNESLAVVSALVLGILFKAFEFIVLPVAYRPDLLVILAVSVGWACGFWASAPAGFALGLLEDLISGRAPGCRAISLSVAAATSTMLKRLISPDAVLSRVIAALLSTFVADAVSYGILRATGLEIGLQYVLRVILPASVVWSMVLILPLGGMNRRFALLLGRIWPAKEGSGREASA
jgi:rod shape-determining protein MreD